MNPIRTRRAWCAALGSAALLALQGPALAQDAWPTRPIKVVVTFPPGGSADAILRAIGLHVSATLGQPLVIENRPGAGGNIGLALVAKADGDGCTLGLGAAGALSANVSLYPQMPFDPVKDFKPVTRVAAIPFVFVGHPSVGARTQAELISLARRDPAKLSIGHGGNGTAMHLTASLFDQMADVPTVAEAGLTGCESVGWFGIVAPASTPDAIVNRLNAAIVGALNDPAIRATIRNLGVEPAPSTPQGFGDYIRSETVKWGQVIRNAGIRIE